MTESYISYDQNYFEFANINFNKFGHILCYIITSNNLLMNTFMQLISYSEAFQLKY